jgi:hypothetical protein
MLACKAQIKIIDDFIDRIFYAEGTLDADGQPKKQFHSHWGLEDYPVPR